jgi:hypothetical protein
MQGGLMTAKWQSTITEKDLRQKSCYLPQTGSDLQAWVFLFQNGDIQAARTKPLGGWFLLFIL